MIRWMVRGSCFVALLVIAQLGLAQEFSADVVNTKDNGELKKLYAGRDKVRFEVETGNAGMGPTAVILDEGQNKYTVVMSERRMYMDAPTTMVKPLMTHYWRVQDVNDALPGVAENCGPGGNLQELGQLHEDGQRQSERTQQRQVRGCLQQGREESYMGGHETALCRQDR